MIDTSSPLICHASGGITYPVRLLATDIRGKFPLLCALDVGPREEVYLFRADGEGQNDNYRLANFTPST